MAAIRPWMTLKPGADGELPVGAFMGEAPWQSQPMEGVRAVFRTDWIGTAALFLILTRFLRANRCPPRIKSGQAFAGKRLGRPLWAPNCHYTEPVRQACDERSRSKTAISARRR